MSLRNALVSLLALASVACKGDATSDDRATAMLVNPDDPRPCASCHAAIVDEWRQSMHARAHHDEDPIYGAMRRLRMDVQGKAVAGKCAKCHNPRSPDDPDSDRGRVGVGCAACHNLQNVHREGKLGADALERAADNRMIAAHDIPAGKSPAHSTGAAAPFIVDGQTLCLACHDALANPKGAPACTTGPEHAEHRDPKATCVSCHMPRVASAGGTVDPDNEHASHAFVGPHRAWYQDDASLLAQSVHITATLDGPTLSVTLENRSGHGFPSGFPGRMVVLSAVGKDAAGAEVWRNFDGEPMKASPESVLNKVYVDDAGKPTLAAFATKLARDNRLAPDESRTLTFEVPQAVMTVDLELRYRLLPPPAASKLGLTTTPEAEARSVATKTIARAQ